MLRADGPAPASRDQAQVVIDAAAIDARVIATSALGGGAKSVVTRVELESGEPLALKVFTRGGNTAREHSAYRLLGDHQLPIPRMLHGAAETPEFPFGYTLLTMAPGAPLNINLAGLDRSRLVEVYRGVGEFQAALHRTAGPGFAILSDERVDRDNAEFMARTFNVELGTFLAHGGSPRLAGRLEAYFDDASARFAQAPAAVLCHGDLHPENIFVAGSLDELAFLGVIDLEEAFTGDPVMDLARTLQSCPFPGDDLTAAVLEGYGGKPEGFDALFDAYFVLYELKLWNYYARGGSRGPLRSIGRRIRRRIRGRHAGG
ncbi:MAG: aminoglycoside phosphotransferase family protein [Thermoleophilaceae bacterium]|nr:aminoglycoside phosphotransferase family protein [Thermoleophilaceae bacterium]